MITKLMCLCLLALPLAAAVEVDEVPQTEQQPPSTVSIPTEYLGYLQIPLLADGRPSPALVALLELTQAQVEMLQVHLAALLPQITEALAAQAEDVKRADKSLHFTLGPAAHAEAAARLRIWEAQLAQMLGDKAWFLQALRQGSGPRAATAGHQLSLLPADLAVAGSAALKALSHDRLLHQLCGPTVEKFLHSGDTLELRLQEQRSGMWMIKLSSRGTGTSSSSSTSNFGAVQLEVGLQAIYDRLQSQDAAAVESGF